MRLRNLLAFLILSLTVNACSLLSAATITAEPAVTQNSSLSIATQMSTPYATATLTNITSITDIFIDALPASTNSCDPDHPWGSISLYIYDLTSEQELVSIDADTPYLFASAFKGPLLTYFLDSCPQYWDATDPQWYAYIQDQAESNIDEWYSSKDYQDLLADYLSDVTNFKDIVSLSRSIRENQFGYDGDLDERYYILEHVYQMVVQSDNFSAGHVLNFVFENCKIDFEESTTALSQFTCGSHNAISAFNGWFNQFSGIQYEPGEIQRGLYSWDVVTTIDEHNDFITERLPTYGLIDKCASQQAAIQCSDDIWLKNTWTARDLFQYYQALFQMGDESVRTAALDILSIDEPGISSGYLKNMARKMNISAMSKNGDSGSVISDAGILAYQGKSYAISVLSYNAFDSLDAIFGRYDIFGRPASNDKGLLQQLIEGRFTGR